MTLQRVAAGLALALMVAGCAGADPTDPVGTWQLAFDSAECGGGPRVEQVRVNNAHEALWPGNNTNSGLNMANVDGDELTIFATNGSGNSFDQIEAVIVLMDPPSATVAWVTATNGVPCRVEIAAENVDVEKVED